MLYPADRNRSAERASATARRAAGPSPMTIWAIVIQPWYQASLGIV